MNKPKDDLDTTAFARATSGRSKGRASPHALLRRDDARSDDRAHNSVALRKERGGTTACPRTPSSGFPADVQIRSLGGYAPAVSGWNFGRRGGWTFLVSFSVP